MSPKLKGTRSGHRSALARILRRFDDMKSNEEFDRDELWRFDDMKSNEEFDRDELERQKYTKCNEGGYEIESDEALHSTVFLAKTDTKTNNNNNNKKPQRSEVAVHTLKPCIYCGESHSPNTWSKPV
ncbi:Hypothetical predicted protein [Mytilus galloprovincialis]|uniref:Uncharacterized protein n=1 Tax=Mytilus galloprovincialis TaxID=29158 RepID=A0A8B6GWB6_MYTGA|nr:Hypothetical predicted protein [Mytilus galloprovincialis]